jgi:site-specific DNA recombinase
MEIALYARVSTERQAQAQTIKVQIDRLQASVAQQTDWHLSETHIYLDDGQSGASLNRPGLDRLRDQAALGAFELVLITAPDRLARNLAHQAVIVEELARHGCQIAFLDRPMSDDPHDQLLLQIRGAVAEYERTLIAERMRRGRQAKLRTGELLPWSVAPYGYILDAEAPRDPKRVAVDAVKGLVVKQIFAWYTDVSRPTSLLGVTRELNDSGTPPPNGGKAWNAASVRNILCNSGYTGLLRYHPVSRLPGHRRRWALGPWGQTRKPMVAAMDEEILIAVPAIIDQAAFEAAQARMERNKQMARRNNTRHDYLLRGLVSCVHCQLACLARTTQLGYNYYACTGRTHPERTALSQRCQTPYLPASTLDALVWADLARILAEPTLITQALNRAKAGAWLPQTLQARQQTLKKGLTQIEHQQERLLQAYLAEIIGQEELARKRQELARTFQGLSQQLRQLETQAQKQLEVAGLAVGIEDFCQRIQPTLAGLDFAQRRKLVELLIDRVLIVGESEIEIRYAMPTALKGEQHPFAICD